MKIAGHDPMMDTCWHIYVKDGVSSLSRAIAWNKEEAREKGLKYSVFGPVVVVREENFVEFEFPERKLEE